MKRILITGADSYIGTSFEKWVKQPQFAGMYEVDTLDMLGDAWKEKDFFGYDSVFHVAGIAHADVGKVTEEQKKLYYKVNCDLAVETAEKAKKSGVKQFIYMSSIIVYGEGTSLRKKRVITRDTKPNPSNFYGESKWRAEQKLTPLGDERFKVAILRPPMIYGEGCKGNYQTLRKISLKMPVFPDFPNERSMLYICNFCEYLRIIIEERATGIHFPKNKEDIKTSELVRLIGTVHNRRTIIMRGLNWCIYLLSYFPGPIGGMINKAFGSVVYSIASEDFLTQYQMYDLYNSIQKTESSEKIKGRKTRKTELRNQREFPQTQTQPKHILVISQYFYPEQFRINDISQEWVKRGYKVTVVTGIPNYPQGEFYKGYGYDQRRQENWNGVNIIRLPIKPRKKGIINLILNYLSYVLEGLKWVNKTKVRADMVYIYEVSPMTQALVGVWYAKKHKIKCHLYVTDLWPENVEIITGIHNKLFLSSIGVMVDYIYKHSDYIYTSSASFIDKIVKRNVNREKIVFWPQYAEEFYKEIERGESLEIPNDGVTNITFAGNLGAAQGLDLLVDAAVLLKSDNIFVRFNIIGTGRYEEKLKLSIKKNSVSKYFNFIPQQPAEKIPEYFAWSDAALIILSKSHVFAMTIPAKTQSCLACGIPILVSADGEVQNIIKDANCGFCSNSGDAEGLVKNIKRFIKLTSLEKVKLSENAVIYYKENFDKTMLMNKMEKSLNE